MLSLSGCGTTPQKAAVNTLASVGLTANAAYEGFLQSALQGNIPTNDVPKVTAYYRDFQASFGAAVAAAQFATNATFANPDLLIALDKLQSAITAVRKDR